jgi:membrane protein
MIYKIWDNIVNILSKIKLKWLENLSLYELLRIYFIGIIKGAFSYRAGAIAFSFFMALFPFTLFILNLLPFIPIPNFQEDFLEFVSQGVPPTTYEAIASIIEDILTNSYKGLLSSGFILSIFLMTNFFSKFNSRKRSCMGRSFNNPESVVAPASNVKPSRSK